MSGRILPDLTQFDNDPSWKTRLPVMEDADPYAHVWNRTPAQMARSAHMDAIRDRGIQKMDPMIEKTKEPPLSKTYSGIRFAQPLKVYTRRYKVWSERKL